jgi:hypothetical protein
MYVALRLGRAVKVQPTTGFQSDRFARKIVQFLMPDLTARLRQPNGNPLGGDVQG